MRERSQGGGGSRQEAGGGRVVPAVVGFPEGVFVGSGNLPGNLVAAGLFLRGDRNPRARLTRHEGRAVEAQLRARRSSNRKQEIVVHNLNPPAQSLLLDHLRV